MSAEGRSKLWTHTNLFNGIERLLQFSYLELLSMTRFHCGVGWLCGCFEMLVLPFICQDQLTNPLLWGAFSDHRPDNEPFPPGAPPCFVCALIPVYSTFSADSLFFI